MKTKAMFFRKGENNSVQCFLCSHNCRIAPDKFGICGVRQNIEGTLYSLVYGETIACHIDPIEKKPLYHFLPGSLSYSIATIGCNFKCGFCQNWQISQISKKDESGIAGEHFLPKDIIRRAVQNKCRSISYTYTEPTVFFEYAYDTAKLAHRKGIYNVFVTNGFMTREAIDKIKPYLNAANVDLKSFNNDFYKKNCKARLDPVLDNIEYMKNEGIWIEVTTLLIPHENDSEKELTQIAGFIAKIGRDIPWHISRFHPQYQMAKASPTSMAKMKTAYHIGKKAGLENIYLGNVLEGNDTICYNCHSKIIERRYFNINKSDIKNGKCNQCKTPIAGIWK